MVSKEMWASSMGEESQEGASGRGHTRHPKLGAKEG